jgi:hypothetical protein
LEQCRDGTVVAADHSDILGDPQPAVNEVTDDHERGLVIEGKNGIGATLRHGTGEPDPQRPQFQRSGK